MRTVLISGANRGLGLEFARQYLAAGDRVIAGARDPSSAKELTSLPGREQLVVGALDVKEDASVKAFRRAFADEPIDILIANAGITGGGRQRRLGDIDYDAWLEAFAVNVLGPVRLAEAFVEQVAAGRERKMVAISSMLGSTEDTTGGQLNNVWRNLALELKDRQIACIAVHPGWVRTDMGGPQAPLEPEQSITALRGRIDSWTQDDTGKFLSWEGKELPW
jgi:NAD(P)-dependent dehydrogenase (short-subunit alcohol dehydrogenase family)